jgi:hypothetical protein
MHKFSIDEAALKEIRRIFSYSKCQDPVASIGEVSSTRFCGICISASERAEYRPEYVHEVGGIMFVLGRDGPERYRGLRLSFDGSRFLFRDSDNIAHTSLLHLPGSPGPELKLTIHAESKSERVTLRCVLKNVSATAAVVDESNLPWLSADRFSIDAVDANGTVGHCKNPPQALMTRIASPPKPIVIAPGESMEGEIDLEAMPISALPREVDVLLLWSYWIRWGRDDGHYMLSGRILLVAKS